MGFVDKKKVNYCKIWPTQANKKDSKLVQSHSVVSVFKFHFYSETAIKQTKTTPTHKSYSLFVGDNDNQYGWDTADNDNNCQSQQRPLCVAYSLHSFLHAGHHLRGSDLQNPSTRREERLELFIDVQEFTIKKPWEKKHSDVTDKRTL